MDMGPDLLGSVWSHDKVKMTIGCQTSSLSAKIDIFFILGSSCFEAFSHDFGGYNKVTISCKG
jgi:hypothetical protein